MINAILQCPLRMRKRLCTTPKPHPLADIVSPFFTPVACLAWQAYFQSYFVSDAELRHVGSYADNNAGGLVAE